MNIYEKALEVLERRGWAQRKIVELNGAVCLEGALVCALGVNVRANHVIPELCCDTPRARRFENALTYLATIINRHCPGPYPNLARSNWERPYRWNDAPMRTYDEVCEILRIAAKEASNDGLFELED